jgi:DNA transposition AAA+ family ATPase
MDGLRDSLKALMDEKGQSMNAVSRSLGISAGALSQWMSGSYPGNTAKIDDSVDSFLKRQKDPFKAPKKPIKFVPTRAAAKTIEVANMCHGDGEIGVVYGDAGLGKTEAVKYYAKKNQDVILIEADLGYSARMLFADIHRRLGLDGRGTIHEMLEDCIVRLKDSERLIIVDEAENLPYRALELLRRLHDKAGIGILLVGMPRLIANLRGKRGEYAQLYSRVGVAAKLGTLTEEDTRSIVDTVLPESNGLWRTFHAECRGNARTLRKLLGRSVRLAKVNSVPVDHEIVRLALETLIV